MGLHVMHFCLVAALYAHLNSAAAVPENFKVLVPKSPVSVSRGHTTTLPCWLSPPQSAEALAVRWYRADLSNAPVLFYWARQFEEGFQLAKYMGRVSLGLKGAKSGGLTAGDVSLQLLNATLEDAGNYTCYVSSDQGYSSASVSLIVTEVGTPPLLSAVWEEDNMVNVSCGSEGWYPEPSLHWSNQKQVLTPKSLKYSKDSSGLLSVHSWLLVSGSSEVSCSVGLPDEEAKEAKVHVENPPQLGKQACGSSAAGWVAFALLLIATLMFAVLGALHFKKREKKIRSGSDHAEEQQNLLPKGVIQPTHLPTAKEYYVNVTLDKAENPYLTVKDGKLRDANRDDFPDGQKVTCLTAIKGTPGFSSGQHYWEVSLGKPERGPKQSWWVGVTSAAVIPQELDFTPTTSNGFWFLSSSPDRAESLHFSTEPNVLLGVCSMPQTVGVYLNYDSGEISFYNVEDKSLIGSLTATFTGEVFPFFNPGKGDKAVMEILQRTEQGQSDDVINSVDATAQQTES